MKKAIFILTVAVLLVGMMSVSAFARGGCGGGMRLQPQYALCTVEDCELVGPHQHDGEWYCAQLPGGCASYPVCAEEGCELPGVHQHDGVYYRCAFSGAIYGTGRGFARGMNL